MKTKLDFKSLIAGVVLGGLIAATIGAGLRADAPAGRFTIETNPNHVFVLDTATGQVWDAYAGPSTGVNSSAFSKAKLTP